MNLVRISLARFISLNYQSYLPFYNAYASDKKKWYRLAKKHAFYVHGIQLVRDKKTNVKTLWEASLNFSELGLPTHVKSFYQKFKLTKAKGIERALCHARRGKEREDLLKFDNELKAIAIEEFEKAFTKYPDVTKVVNEYCHWVGKSKISLSTVKAFFGNPEIQNRCRVIKNGREWYDDNIAVSHHFNKPSCKGELFQIDGTRLQIPYWNDKRNRVDFLTIFIIYDVHSSKVVGYSVDRTENHKMILLAFKRCFESTGYIAKNIFLDGSSAYKHEDFQFLIHQTQRLGVMWSKVRHPRSKAFVERFNHTFQSRICIRIPEYIGLGITSTGTDARKTRNEIKKLLKRINLRSRPEVERIVDQLIADYNHTEFVSESPYQKEKKSKIKNAVLLRPEHKALLTWNIAQRKVKKSQIRLGRDNDYRYYPLPEGLRLANSNGLLHVAYRNELPEFIFIYDLQYKFLAKLKKSVKVEICYNQRSRQEHNYAHQTIQSRERLYESIVEEHYANSQQVAQLKQEAIPVELIDFSPDKETEYEAARAFTLKAYEAELENEIPNIPRYNHIISSYKINKNEIGKEL
ncbi:MAG: hypothetical protein AAF149_13665 [Bacteroidota bacterium]